MKRSWAARPDEDLVLMDGRVLGVVSDHAQQQALCEAQVIQKRIGGYITSAAQRVPTEVPGEMVTTFYVVTWQDRTDAKPQPEHAEAVVPQPEAKARFMAEMDAIDAKGEADARALAGDAPVPDHIDEADGFDYSTLAAEDVEEAVVR